MIESIKNKFHEWYEILAAKIKSFDRPTDFFIAIGLYFLAGFLLGLFIKYFGKLVFLAGIITLALVYGLQYLGVITVHFTSLTDMLGLADPVTLQDIWLSLSSWVKSHLMQAIAAAIGIFVALECA